nr:GTP pyrophosphokinase [Ipomoea batatas]
MDYDEDREDCDEHPLQRREGDRGAEAGVLCRHLPECSSALRSNNSYCLYYPKAGESLRLMLRYCASYTDVRICNRTQDSQIKLIDELWELHLPGNPFKNARIPGNGEIKLIVGEVVPKFMVSSSLTSVLTSGNAIAAAAAAGSGTVHGAVTSAITQVVVTAVAIASGACLSTKVDCLWPKVDEQPGSLVLDGVDVTGCPIFNDPQVLKAIEFARKAHHGQISKVETKNSLVTVPPFSSLCLIRMHSPAVMQTSFCKSPDKTLLVNKWKVDLLVA